MKCDLCPVRSGARLLSGPRTIRQKRGRRDAPEGCLVSPVCDRFGAVLGTGRKTCGAPAPARPRRPRGVQALPSPRHHKARTITHLCTLAPFICIKVIESPLCSCVYYVNINGPDAGPDAGSSCAPPRSQTLPARPVYHRRRPWNPEPALLPRSRLPISAICGPRRSSPISGLWCRWWGQAGL